MITLDTCELSSNQLYKLISAAVTPRPIAWVSTLSAQGSVNLAPFSSYTFLTYDPPKVGISIGPTTGRIKDTLANIEARGEFVINSVTTDMVRVMADTAYEYPPEISEAQLLEIPLSPSKTVAPPRVAGSCLAMECRLERVVELEDNDRHRFLIGEVVAFQISEAIWSKDRIDASRYNPIGRIGGPLYVTRGEMVRAEVGKVNGRA